MSKRIQKRNSNSGSGQANKKGGGQNKNYKADSGHKIDKTKTGKEIFKEITDFMAQQTEELEQDVREKEEQGKYLVDCAAYQSFTNHPLQDDQILTEKPNVHTANGNFQKTHKTMINLTVIKDRIKIPAFRDDNLKKKLLSTQGFDTASSTNSSIERL